MAVISCAEKPAICPVRLEIGREQLPGAFEAEERTVPGLGDLLHLVSGRTLLGVVRERTSRHLSSPAAPDMLGQQNGPGRLPEWRAGAFAGDSARRGGMQAGAVRCSSAQELHAVRAEQRSRQSREKQQEEEGRQDRQHGEQREPGQILDMYLDEELVAVAVRQKEAVSHADTVHAHAAAAQQHGDGPSGEGQQGGMPGVHGTLEQQKRQGLEGPPGPSGVNEVIRVYDAGGRLLSEEREGTLRAPGRGVRFSVVRSATPLVRHVYFVAEDRCAAASCYSISINIPCSELHESLDPQTAVPGI